MTSKIGPCINCGKPYPCGDDNCSKAIEAARKEITNGEKLIKLAQLIDYGRSNRCAYLDHAMLCQVIMHNDTDYACDCGYDEIVKILSEYMSPQYNINDQGEIYEVHEKCKDHHTTGFIPCPNCGLFSPLASGVLKR